MIVPFKATPAARYVHPRAVDIEEQEDEHELNLDIASDAAPNYLRWVADLCAPHLGESVLEVGAGIGAVTQHLVHGRRVVATDLSQTCVDAMRQRFEGLSNVQVLQADLRSWDPGEIFDSVLLVNVLEHIRDDVRALSSLRRFVRPGGSIVIYVPALNGLFGPWDRRAGHFRRYSKWRLRAVMREASLQPEELRYANLMAIPAWILFSSVSKVDSEGESSLSIWDRTAVPLTQFLETRIRVPIGLNLLGVGRVE